MSVQEKQKRYQELAHAMQTGVAYVLEFDPSEGTPKHLREGTPKHLRVGVNMAMIEHSALFKLLLAKGTISEEEYYDAVIELLEQEVESYTAKLQEHYGGNVKITLA